jgi:prepilin-type N-terminal cleavage/methylation domain-containing protein
MTTPRREGERGFTLVEVMIAVVVLTVGLLGLVSTAALVTRMIGRGQRSSVAAAFSQRIMEEQRLAACTTRNDGSRDLYRGTTRVAQAGWRWSAPSASTFRLEVTTTYTTRAGMQRTDVMETTISCII